MTEVVMEMEEETEMMIDCSLTYSTLDNTGLRTLATCR